MTAAQIIYKLESAWPQMLTQKQWGLARFGDRDIRRKLADMATARGGNALTPLEWHEISKWGINDEQSRVADHRKDGTFRRRNKAALKGAAARVVLPAQRVEPDTLATLQRIAPEHGGIGRTIDAAVRLLANGHGELRSPKERTMP